jgi:hypothetical protein
MKRPRLLATSTICALAVALAPLQANAAEGPPPDPRPWGKGTLMPSFGFGLGFGPDIHVLSFSGGVSYFVWHGLAVGLNVTDTVYIYREDFKNAYPGINKTSPTNEVLLLPTLQYVFLRRMRFSPYAIAGVGPVFYNHQRGTIGQWLVGAGVYIGMGSMLALNIGIDFYANFPGDKWDKAFTWDPPGDAPPESIRGCALTNNPCSFNLSPHIGLVFMLGGKGKAKSRRAKPAPESPPPNPMEEPVAEPLPPPEPTPEPVPEPVPEVAPSPDAPTPVETPVDAPPVEPSPTTDAPPPPASAGGPA